MGDRPWLSLLPTGLCSCRQGHILYLILKHHYVPLLHLSTHDLPTGTRGATPDGGIDYLRAGQSIFTEASSNRTCASRLPGLARPLALS
ncbi:hypothetical protein CALCODRAFT_498515 [Calocera cornea HHB12733]|uniref:Uncharacterized protein n=1 Tax=Calocera cornea HHB12733 TaxID=1353952 RepID=A0A165ETU4_9BASI|nr:hypothetical protein CALCODRAFT_498515 [Calocera cornea HHB12733]